MAGVMNPGRRTSGTLLDYVLKGVQVAADVYGVKQKGDIAEQESLDKKSALQAATEQKTALQTATTADKAEARTLAGARDAETVRSHQANEKNQRDQIAATRANNAAKTTAKTETAAAKVAASSSLRGRLDSLNSEERKRLDSAAQGLEAVNNMASAMKDGDWTVHPIGDNNFTLARKNYVEAIGRMQSGGVIGPDEGRNFRSFVPEGLDSSEIQQEKLTQAYTEMALRLKNLGFTPEEMAEARSGIKVPENVAGKGGASGKWDTAVAAPAGKQVVSKQYSPSRNQTKFIYSDKTEEVVDGQK